jgi:hypothetical protein
MQGIFSSKCDSSIGQAVLNIKSARAPVTNIKPCVVLLVLIGHGQDTLSVVLHHFCHFHHPNPLALNQQGVTRFITSAHIAFMIESIEFVGVM